MSKKKLLEIDTCPYCGKDATLGHWEKPFDDYGVSCNDTHDHGCFGPTRKTANGAIKAWNARKTK